MRRYRTYMNAICQLIPQCTVCFLLYCIFIAILYFTMKLTFDLVYNIVMILTVQQLKIKVTSHLGAHVIINLHRSTRFCRNGFTWGSGSSLIE